MISISNLVRGKTNAMHFSIPLSSAWIVDHDDKPMRDITEKVKRYSGPRNDFHGQKVPLEHFLFYDRGGTQGEISKDPPFQYPRYEEDPLNPR